MFDRSRSSSPEATSRCQSTCVSQYCRALLNRVRHNRCSLLIGLATLAAVAFLVWPRAKATTGVGAVHLKTRVPDDSVADARSLTGPNLASKVTHLTHDLRNLAEHGVHAILTGRVSPSRDEVLEAQAVLPAAHKTLRFPVCNGFANQRLSVVYGILIAVRTGRTPVLPVFIRDGIQRDETAVTATADNKTPFEQVYDLNFFLHELAKRGIRVLEPQDAPKESAYTRVELASVNGNIVGGINNTYKDVLHVTVDCPLFKLTPGELSAKADEPVIWSVLDAMRPADKAFEYAASMQHAILKLGGLNGKAATKYNFLHLRMENDWVAHCERWSNINDGMVRDNCYNNTETIDVQLRLFAFSTDVPLYVASFWTDVDPERAKKVMSRLVEAGYRVITSADVFPEAMKNEGREMRALVEYYVGFGANRFIGNSVSTFAALALLERRHLGQWAAYYNGGNVPIAPYLPVHKLAWVFTYNSWSAKYDYMLKAAVRSANSIGTLKPFCIFDGNTSSPIGRWLVDQNVTLIRHVPTWRQELIQKAQARMKENVQHSHLYKNPDMLVSTFQRVDLPVVPILDQYTYVLYTDADVYFRRPIHLDDFGLPLPRSVSMSYEFYKMFPYNAGIILANLPTMRRNYKAFLHMMLDNDDGLYYPNFGPADQGIINKFYEKDLRSQMLNQAFNTKPYNDFDAASFLVHFHGPKPHEYLSFLETGKCDFYSVCEQGILRSLCQYAKEWAVFIPEESVATRLSDSCSWLTNPTIMAVFQKRTGLVAQNQAVPDDKKQEFTQRQRLLRRLRSSRKQLST
ncbi:hypothetical protein HYH03_018113 [Edaphochlamys debaryana]|uniref:O-fucosyltransferase family protein n=1 Tax=Edaphochlamys debaryana TaxID=47281 RepID=A0A835XEE0_9CHLO|nr:hypothetical protein HYH03_018113 [Edaphochlamys debaryana]|eukprot:KAG2482987.1 hypothetical protein HYH03_018113 [Edaphochlamys debaryana]